MKMQTHRQNMPGGDRGVSSPASGNRASRVALLLLSCVVGSSAQGAMTWRSTPEIVTQEARHAGHSHAGPQRFYLREGEGADVSLRLPDLSAKPAQVLDGNVALRPTGADGYHLLFARRTSPGEEQAAFRYVYLAGKPSGHSPREQLEVSTSRLEIVPTPLPREHWRYESSEPAVFQVRFDGAPLANLVVRMTTSNGSLIEETTNFKGMVRFLLPEDFSRVGSGRAMNLPGDFVVEAVHNSSNDRFVTTLNAEYHVNPKNWQSTFAGSAVLAAGFFVGLLAVRPRKENA